MDRQELVRAKLIDYLKKTGVKQTFISKHVELETSVLSRFKSGKRDLWDDSLDVLDKWLDERGQY